MAFGGAEADDVSSSKRHSVWWSAVCAIRSVKSHGLHETECDPLVGMEKRATGDVPFRTDDAVHDRRSNTLWLKLETSSAKRSPPSAGDSADNHNR